MAHIPLVPGDVPVQLREQFIARYQRITKETGNLFLFVVDHKLEHLNDDFLGLESSFEHVLRIAQLPEIGAFATYPGLIARYGQQFPTIPYIMKLNGKTNLASHASWFPKLFLPDPYSAPLWSVEQAVTLAENMKINLYGIAMTIYLGSAYEDRMLSHAAQAVHDAHQNGLLALLWIYPRGRAVHNPQDAHILAGAAGVANSLGADFVKIHPPVSEELLLEIVAAAGNTSVICAGGKQVDPATLIERTRQQLHYGTRGAAVGRNLFQSSLSEAKELAEKMSALIYQNV